MFDAALIARTPPQEERRAALWSASLAGALLLHLAACGLALWLAAPAHLPKAPEPLVIELSLEPLSQDAPLEAPSESSTEEEPEREPPPPPSEATAPEAPPPEPAPEPDDPAPAPIQPVAPRVEAPPPRPPAPRPRPQPPQPARERRGSPDRAAAAPAPLAPGPAAPSGPPVFTQARFRRPPTPPEYPLVARERGLTGTALIRALVGVDGETREVRLHRSSGHEMLDNAALAAVRRWSFEPSARDRQRLESWIEVPIRFQLR